MACKVCSQAVTCIFDEKDTIPYYWCMQCDYISIDEGKIISHAEEKERYSKHENTCANKGYVRMFNDFIEKTVMRYSSHVHTVLDFGCGTSPVLATLLTERGFSVDIYDKYFAPEKVYENKKYDLITATEVFEHVRDPLGVMNLFKHHLTERGIVAIMTLFHPNDFVQFKKWWYRKDATHISFYTPKTFQYIAHIFGLKILRADNKNVCVFEKNE